MKLNIRVSWPAWLGMNSTADIVADTFATLWYEVITNIEYQSIIKWWLNQKQKHYIQKIFCILLLISSKLLNSRAKIINSSIYFMNLKKIEENIEISKIKISISL